MTEQAASAALPRLTVARQGDDDFDATLAALAHRGETDLERVEQAVRAVLKDVRSEGDAAVRRYVERFEKRTVEHVLSRDYGGQKAFDSLPAGVQAALKEGAERIERYHRRQLEQQQTFEYVEDGVRLGSRVTPLARVGVYAPGGKARYPSSVLMSAVIARVAGVNEIIVASPDPGVEVRAACWVSGVHAILDAGGAQAVAALAFGTSSVPKVDKIVGPGNIYVAAAKRLVFGDVAIDSIAGPSEILVLADDSASPAVVAADLLSQAEHDEAAYPLLVSTSAALVEQVQAALASQLAALPRCDIATASIRDNGYALIVNDVDTLVKVANDIAGEHVAVQMNDAAAVADRVVRAGALFVGHSTPEAAGDYLAGPSHVLPTGGAARFSAPLGVYDFISRSSVIEYQPAALAAQAGPITTLARVEGLEAHARAVEIRTKG